MTEQFTNFGFTYLNGAIDASTTTVVVNSYASFPGTAPFRITVDQEIMIVTAGAGTLSWTVTRGAESTTAATHASGAIVAQTLTKTGLSNTINDQVLALGSTGALSALPTVGTSGRLYYPTDGNAIMRDNGTSWVAFGPIYAFTVPNISGWTWINQGSYGTIAQEADGVYYADTGGQTTTDEWRAYVNTIGSPSGDWTFTTAFTPNMWPNNAGSYCGIALFNIANNKGLYFVVQFDGGGPTVYAVYTGNATGQPVGTNYTANLKGFTFPIFMKITKVSNNLFFYISKDFRHWQQRYSETVANYLGAAPDKYGTIMNNFNTNVGYLSSAFYHELKLV